MAARGVSAADTIRLDEDEDEDEMMASNAAGEEDGQSLGRGVKRRHPHTKSILENEDDASAGKTEQNKKGEEADVKVEWTDESDGAYERLAKRNKRGVSRRGSGRGRGGAKTKRTAVESKGSRCTAAGGRLSSSHYGRPDRSRRPGRYLSTANDDSDSSDRPIPNEGRNEDEDNLDIPDYILQRRREFEERQTVLREAGLLLPPDYTDVYFSDDDRSIRRVTGRVRGPLQKRPQFDSTVRPSRECKDVPLQYSAGVIPGCIAQYLRDYQIAGVQFLHRLFVYQRGGILGDDMGLGKTVQVAAFLTAAFGKTGDERDGKRMRKMRRAAAVGSGSGSGSDGGRWYPVVLVVCPGSLIQNWRNELQRWGWWHVDVYHGAGKDDVLQAARAGRLEIMVTTYATYKNHRERINTVKWDAVVADECHVLKERHSGTTRAMDEVNALCRIGLTGTAIQNRYAELWTLLNWTNPGQFGSLREWNQTISRPLTIGQSHDATLYQLSLARRTAKKLVQNLLPDVFLRRMKSLIAGQLPRKTDRVVFCPLTERQAVAYANFVDSPDVVFLRSVSDLCDCGSGGKRGWCCYRCLDGPGGRPTSWSSLVFPAIQSLLKLANHLMLMVPSADGVIGMGASINTASGAASGTASGTASGVSEVSGGGLSAAHIAAAERHERALRLLQTCVPNDWATLYRNRDSMVNLANPEFCGKWKVLRKLLRFWHDNGDKVLVFSHNVRLLQILQHLFHGTSYNVSYLDGSLSYEDRQRVVDDFNTDPAQFVFLISTKAGGVGLNITSANKVVIFDPHWNPAYDLQAQDRAYRIGQVRDVDVFRLVSAGTIEEIVYARQIYKQQQANIGYSASTERRYFRGVQQDSERKGEIFGLNNLLTFHADQVVLRDIVNKTNIAEAKAGVHLTDIDMEQAAADRDIDALVKLEGGSGGGDDDNDDETENHDHDMSSVGALRDGSTADRTSPGQVTATKRSKSDAVQAILASAGVEYTHNNSEVIGSSRVEAQLSRRAELVLSDEDEDCEDDNVKRDEGEDGYARQARGHHHHHHHHDNTASLLADTSAAFVAAGGMDDDDDDADLDSVAAGRLTRLRYNPPADVMRRQFCSMAREAGFATATDFALVVESWTPEQRRQCLEGFYRRREAQLQQLRQKSVKEEAVIKDEDVKPLLEDEEEPPPTVKKEMKEERNSPDLFKIKGLKDEREAKREPGLPMIKTEDGEAGRDFGEVIDLVSSSPPRIPGRLATPTAIGPRYDDDDDDETDEL